MYKRQVYKDGPIRFGSFFHGERYDANKEALTENWTKPEYNDSHWQSPDIISQRDWIDFDIVAPVSYTHLTKEISVIMGIALRSVELKKYRLKRKLNLEQESSLTSYILTI